MDDTKMISETIYRSVISTEYGSLEVREVIYGSSEVVISLSPLDSSLRGFDLSREAVEKLHKILGSWLKNGHEALDCDFSLAV